MLSKNEELNLIVTEVSGKDKKINLSLKQTLEDPWEKIENYYTVNQKVNASVLHILEKGIIFITSDNFECILPMSKVKDKTLFEQNKSYDLIVCEVNNSNRRIVLNLDEGNSDNKNDVSDNDQTEDASEEPKDSNETSDITEEKSEK